MELKVQRLRMIDTELTNPEVLQPPSQVEASLIFTVLPLITHPVDEQLAYPRVIAFVGLGRPEVRPDDLVGGPVGWIIGLALAWPGGSQDLVHLMLGFESLCLAHLRADHGLHEPVNLQRATALVHLDEREPADIPDHPGEHELLTQRLIQGQQESVQLVAVKQIDGDRPRRKKGQQLQQAHGRR